jgi:hypothetical protein
MPPAQRSSKARAGAGRAPFEETGTPTRSNRRILHAGKGTE